MGEVEHSAHPARSRRSVGARLGKVAMSPPPAARRSALTPWASSREPSARATPTAREGLRVCTDVVPSTARKARIVTERRASLSSASSTTPVHGLHATSVRIIARHKARRRAPVAKAVSQSGNPAPSPAERFVGRLAPPPAPRMPAAPLAVVRPDTFAPGIPKGASLGVAADSRIVAQAPVGCLMALARTTTSTMSVTGTARRLSRLVHMFTNRS